MWHQTIDPEKEYTVKIKCYKDSVLVYVDDPKLMAISVNRASITASLKDLSIALEALEISRKNP